MTKKNKNQKAEAPKESLAVETIEQSSPLAMMELETYLLWLKINRTKKRGNYPTPSLPSLAIVRNGLRQKKENFVSSSNLVLSFRPMASFITSQ